MSGNLVASFGTFVSAEEIGDTHENGVLNDSAVRALVVRYFREREAYLNTALFLNNNFDRGVKI